jgi:hypothetical protein
MVLLMDVRGVVVLGGIAFEAISERLDFQSEGSCFGREGQDQLPFHSICGAHEGLDGEVIGAVHHGGDPGGADFHPRGELVSVQAEGLHTPEDLVDDEQFFTVTFWEQESGAEKKR